jgi:hypothetical protein
MSNQPALWTPYTFSFIHSFIHDYSTSVGPWPLLQFHNLLFTDGKTPWTSDQPVARPLPTHRTIQTQINAHRHQCLWEGFESTIPAFERAKTVHALGRATAVISCFILCIYTGVVIPQST